MPTHLATVIFVISLLLTCVGAASAATVTVAGSGGMIPLLTALGSAYMKSNPQDVIRVNPNSLTQSGGILAAKSGAVDIGMSARPLAARELSYSIDAFHIANVAATVAVHHNVPVTNLTSQQLCAIYAGKITNWRELGGHNARIVAFTRPDSDSTKQAFREGISCFRELNEAPNTLRIYKSNDMLSALQQTADAIGIIDSIVLEQAKGKARKIRLDGRYPSTEAVASGSWPVIKKYTLVLGKNRSAAVNRFMLFIKSQEGTSLIRKYNGIPVDFSYP